MPVAESEARWMSGRMQKQSLDCGGIERDVVQVAFPVESVEEIPGFEGILAYWRSKTSEGRVPVKSSIDILDIADWAPRLAISERKEDDVTFRLFGGDFVQLFGRELTGQPLIANMAPEIQERCYTHLWRLLDTPLCGHTYGPVPAEDRSFLQFNVLDLPLSRESGEVEFLLHALHISKVS